VRHLFPGHEIHVGSRFALSASSETAQRSVAFEVTETPTKEPESFTMNDADRPTRLTLAVTGYPQPDIPRIPLSPRG
jgi:hypothetical protein